MYFYRALMGEGAFPILAGFVSGIYISAALVLQIHLLNLKAPMVKFLYGALYISCIQWSSQLIYSMQCDAVALGLLCATVSVWALERSRYLLACVALTLSLGFYQTCGLYFLSLALSIMLFKRNDIFRQNLIYGGVILASLAAYGIINWGIKNSPLVSVASTEYMRMVQADLNQWSIFAALPLPDKVIFACHYCKIAFLNALGIGNQTYWLYGSVVVPFACLFSLVWRQENGFRLLVKCSYLLAIWVSPFALSMVMGREMEFRTSLAAPLSLAAMWALAFKEGKWNGKSQFSAVVLCGVLLLKSAYTVGAQARDDAYEYSVAMQEIERMHSSAAAVAGGDDICLIVVAGRPDKDSRSPHTLFFRNGTFNVYARHYHWDLMKHAAEIPAKHRALYQTMPEWPDPGSVRLNEGEVLIRITD